jgi:hypothetical protein
MAAPADGRDAKAVPRSNRAILAIGLALCILGAVVVAYLLGLLDWIGLLS